MSLLLQLQVYKLTDEHILQLCHRMVSELVCVEIGTALGIDQYAIDACLHNNQRDITLAGYTILRKWAEMKENRVTAWKELADALRICELNSWVVEILKK